MGKGDHRTNAKRAAAKARAAMPELAKVPKREKDGRESRSDRDDYDRDASGVVLRARCRMSGKRDNAENRKAVSDQSYEGQAGLAINKGARDEQEAKRLSQVYTSLDASEATYYRHYIGQSRHAKTAKIEMMPMGAFEVRDDDRPDFRTPEEKARDACNSWMWWQGRIGHLGRADQIAINDGLKHRCEFIRDAVLTTRGMAFIAAIRSLARVVDKWT